MRLRCWLLPPPGCTSVADMPPCCGPAWSGQVFAALCALQPALTEEERQRLLRILTDIETVRESARPHQEGGNLS